MKIVLVSLVVLFGFQAQAGVGQEKCLNKKILLKEMCKVQELIEGTAHFSACSNGYAYYIETNVSEKPAALTGSSVTCKMVEVRNEKSIDKRTTYFDEQSQKVVVYDHTNGLSNTFVYGYTGYYHISELENGDSLYNFYSFEN